MILTITMNPAIDRVYGVNNFQVNSLYRPDSMTSTAGGKGLNVARVAKTLGSEVAATGLLGGITGQYISEQVDALGIKNHFVKIAGTSRICINIIDFTSNTSTEILETGPEVKEIELNIFFKKFKSLIKSCKIVTASGSLPRQVPDDFYRRLIEYAKKHGKKFILDTTGNYFCQGIKSKPYMVAPNQDEVKAYFNMERINLAECILAVKKLSREGIVLPVITLGSAGVLANYNDSIFHYQAKPIKTVSAVGSGDAFVAGCAVALSQEKSVKETIKLGMACGMSNCNFLKTGIISKEQVKSYYEQIKIHRVD